MLLSASIIFPHLGIKIPHFSTGITIGNFTIAFYGIIVALAMITIITVAMLTAKKDGQNVDDYIDIAIASTICAIIGARLYYVIFNLDYYLANPSQIINLRAGGLAIYGGLIGGIFAAFVVCRVKKISFLQAIDNIAPGIVLAQAIGRWGNFFNREAFGEYTDSLFAMRIKYDEVQGVITETMEKNAVYVDGVKYIQVSPTFLYESLWCLAVFILIMIFRKYRKYYGEIVLWYVFGYSAGRSWIEGLRTDQLLIGSTGIPVSQLLSIALAVGSLALLIILRIRIARGESLGPAICEGTVRTGKTKKERLAELKEKAEKRDNPTDDSGEIESGKDAADESTKETD